MDQNQIEVPCHFLCPISLQLMRDPVTVSSGITYDRENIERWLFSCKNNTCPVTKQVLSQDDQYLTPNHNLRRLIQAWCTLNASFGIERIPTPKQPVDKSHIAKLLNDAKRFPNMRLQCLKRLRSIALESERNRSFVEAAGTVDFLVSIIKNERSYLIDGDQATVMEDDCGFSSASDEALCILFHLKLSGRELKTLFSDDGEFLESLVQILKNGNYQSRAFSTMLLKSIFEVADPIHLISMKREIFIEIMRVLRDQISQQATKAALKLLLEVCPWGRNRIKAVDGGIVPILIELLLDASDKRVCELILTVLDQLCGCADGRAEMLNHGAGLAVVSKKILRVSHVASDKAVRILGSICRFSANSRVLQEMLQVGVVAKLCLVLQIDGGYKCKERAKEILKLHSRVWKNSPCIPPHLMSSYPS